ncbi:SGNH/GDSL hydrolase family protein [Acholeplasma hippikon]|uniref:GDSL-like Lipase/Acylhydrolase n=1 Tax=Acholeplasma hippikon TaxID=264636 RepID=A0A449BIG1_9MOLU|nr:GDSL-type esterase/lipase family protein [Acholeplasma hippikon]VEU82203.1 GDSL-like Lipase/Acylhydrolase [Acholeplasma hippikon]
MKKVVFMGDSITAQFKLLSQYENIVNIGVGGYKTTELIPLVKELRLHQPDIVVLLIGINDFLCNKRFFEHGYTIPFHKTYDTLLDMITVNLPRTKLYVVSMLPVAPRKEGMLNETNALKWNEEIAYINQFIKHQSKVYRATYLDLYHEFIKDGMLNSEYSLDGIHLTEKGYLTYLDFLKKHTEEIFI